MIQLKHLGSLRSIAATLKKEKDTASLFPDNLQLTVSILFPAVGWRLLCQAKLKDNCLINSSKSWQSLPTRAGPSFNERGAPFCVYFSIDFLNIKRIFPDTRVFAAPQERLPEENWRAVNYPKNGKGKTAQSWDEKAKCLLASPAFRSRHQWASPQLKILLLDVGTALRETFLGSCCSIETSEETTMEEKSLVCWP